MVGHIEESGILNGFMKFVGDGGTPYELFTPGIEKSSIPSFRMIPVRREIILHPNLGKHSKSMIRIRDQRRSSNSTLTMC